MHPSGVAKSSTCFGWGKGWNVTSAGWQVTLCDPIWHVSSSGVATSVIELLYPCYFTYFTLASTDGTDWTSIQARQREISPADQRIVSSAIRTRLRGESPTSLRKSSCVAEKGTQRTRALSRSYWLHLRPVTNSTVCRSSCRRVLCRRLRPTVTLVHCRQRRGDFLRPPHRSTT